MICWYRIRWSVAEIATYFSYSSDWRPLKWFLGFSGRFQWRPFLLAAFAQSRSKSLKSCRPRAAERAAYNTPLRSTYTKQVFFYRSLLVAPAIPPLRSSFQCELSDHWDDHGRNLIENRPIKSPATSSASYCTFHLHFHQGNPPYFNKFQ